MDVMKVGIVGFPGSGKTTVFNVLTGLNAQTGVRAKEGSPHVGVIKVPDQRLESLAALLTLKKVTHAEIIFMDFPQGKDERVLDFHRATQIKEADALAQVVRCFTDPYSQNLPAPLKEIQEFEAEIKLTDLTVIENRLDRLKKEKGHEREKELLEHCKAFIEQEKPLRLLSLNEKESKALSGFGFLSQKPLLVLLNTGEEDIGRPPSKELADLLLEKQLEVVPLCGKIEMEVIELDEEARLEFLKELGISESARERFIRSCYGLLQLVTFLTYNEEEVRAWSIRKGTTALKAAGKVHSDIERGFIRAEVIHYNDFVKHRSEAKCREAGKFRLEGKEYVVQDGDIVRFRFHV
jgi:GTP-binding protein YchF